MPSDLNAAIREIIQDEIEVQIAPLRDALSRIASAFGGVGSVGAPAARRNGKIAGPRAASGGAGRRTRAADGANDRLCALVGCKRTARAKGYCAAHYQKYRNLQKTGRLPAAWKEYAPPNSVADIKLPRGRAGAAALAAARGRK